MIRNELQQQQPIVYQILKNAIDHNRFAHAYLFHGPEGTPLKESAYFFAKCIMCKEDDMACEFCSICQRISSNEYTDLIFIDGSETSIKKDQILKLQYEFNKTCLENGGKKVYIIHKIENATPEALNSLLKFLEEPSDDVIAILIAEKLDLVLPTIQSRCQIMSFKAYTQNYCFMKSKQSLDPIDAYLLSNLIRSTKGIEEINDTDDYQHARYLFRLFIDKFLQSPFKSLLALQLEGTKTNNKKLDKKSILYFIRMLVVFFKDCCYGNTICEDLWYNSKLKEMGNKRIDYIHILHTLIRTEDKLLKPVNIQLLLDQLVFEMKEAIYNEETRGY